MQLSARDREMLGFKGIPDLDLTAKEGRIFLFWIGRRSALFSLATRIVLFLSRILQFRFNPNDFRDAN
jgi:hypothetical protein